MGFEKFEKFGNFEKMEAKLKKLDSLEQHKPNEEVVEARVEVKAEDVVPSEESSPTESKNTEDSEVKMYIPIKTKETKVSTNISLYPSVKKLGIEKAKAHGMSLSEFISFFLENA